jgi:hypothetical protein
MKFFKKSKTESYNSDIYWSILNNSADGDYSHINNHLDEIFSNDSLGLPKYSAVLDRDTSQEYNLNKNGFRSLEITSTPDLVVAGCSFTFGMGVPADLAWGGLLARKLGEDYYNISVPGISIQQIVRYLFDYFRKYGNPKNLVCLFPDASRLTIPVNENILIANTGKNYPTLVKNAHLSINKLPLSIRAKYAKRPYVVEDIIPMDVPLYYSMQSINMLSQYCRSNNINFIWGTWHSGFESAIEHLKIRYSYDDFVYLGMNKWTHTKKNDYKYLLHDNSKCPDCNNNLACSLHLTCHYDLHEKYGDLYYLGTDINMGKGKAHCGVHTHAHIAEAFEAVLLDLLPKN